MRYSWDPKKNAANIAKHRIDFADAAALFEGPAIVRQDRRKDYGENRFIALGILEGIVLSLVFTDRSAGERRIISFRRANRKERRSFRETFGL
jgi:uncharacterized DUF497 family protein